MMAQRAEIVNQAWHPGVRFGQWPPVTGEASWRVDLYVDADGSEKQSGLPIAWRAPGHKYETFPTHAQALEYAIAETEA